VRCETPPSISNTESSSETIVPGVQAISDSGNAGAHLDYSKILDGDLDTMWQATSDRNVFVVFDMQREVSITSFAMLPHTDTYLAQYHGPLSFKLESGTTATGPWTSVYSTDGANPRSTWKTHVLSPASSAARYFRMYVNYCGANACYQGPCRTYVSEMAFFDENPGIRGE
jgi:hypothetical protein